jgi:hypothetical protein
LAGGNIFKISNLDWRCFFPQTQWRKCFNTIVFFSLAYVRPQLLKLASPEIPPLQDRAAPPVLH